MNKPALPKQSTNQLRGIQAQEIVAMSLSRIAFVHRVETGTDIGVDFICELRKDGNPTSKIFNVQCKVLPKGAGRGTGRPIKLQIKVSTARYWLEQSVPTILCVADSTNGDVYWSDPLAVLSIRSDAWREQKTVFLSVDEKTVFSCFVTPPANLTELLHAGSRRIGASFRERLYPLENIIAKDQRGMGSKVTDVGKQLLGDRSALADSFSALQAIVEFHEKLVKVLTPRVDDYCTFIFDRAQKVYGRMLKVRGNTSVHAPLLCNFGAGQPSVVIANAKAAVQQVSKSVSQVSIEKLLRALEALENLHAHLETEGEKILVKDRPLIDALFLELGPQVNGKIPKG